MATNRQLFVHYNKTGGMNQSGRPFNLPPEDWHLDFNMRPFEGELRQVPLKKVRQYTIPYSGRTMLELANIATGSGSLLIGLTEDKVKRIVAGNGVNLKEAGTEVTLDIPGTYTRYGRCVFNNQLFFCNESNEVRYTDGTQVVSVGGTCPRGRYVEVWFDHLVVGGPIFPGEDAYNCVAWSHLNEWSNFTPDTDSEADRYVFTEYQREFDVVPGVTGVKKLGNACMVYTASSIFQMRYTGLPRVVRVDPIIQDFGNGFKYSLASVNGRHFFIDSIAKTFVMFTGIGIEIVGTQIAKYFFDSLNPDPFIQQRTWSYVDPRYREIWWVYVSKDSPDEFDRAVVYNYAEKKWFVASVENIHCFAMTVDEGVLTCDQLTGTANNLLGICDKLGGASGEAIRLWGGANERLLVEETSDDTTTDLLNAEVPTLETGDQVFGGIQQVKEICDVALQCNVPNIEVELAKRMNVDDPVAFKKVGVWNPVKKPVLDLEKVADRVFRWRFRPGKKPATTETVFLTGVTNFQLRTEMAATTPVVGFYVTLNLNNPSPHCSYVVAGGSVTNIALMDTVAVVFQKLSGPNLGSYGAGTLKEVFRVFFDQAFLDTAVLAGPDALDLAFEMLSDHYTPDGDDICQLTSSGTSRTLTYRDVADIIVSQSGVHTGASNDPYEVTLSDS